MTYATIETSAQSGRPVELYDFSIGSAHYRYTSSDGDVSYGGNTYAAVPIARSAVEATNETARLALNITCDRSLGVLALSVAWLLLRHHNLSLTHPWEALQRWRATP